MADDNNLNIGITGNSSGIEGASSKATSSVKSVTAAAADLQKAFRSLKSSLDPMYQAQEKFNKSVADAHALFQAEMIDASTRDAAIKSATEALETYRSKIASTSAAAQQAAAEEKAAAQERAANEKAMRDQEVAAARQAAQEKIAAARQERAEKAKLEAQELAAIKLAAQMARQAAREAATDAKSIDRPSVVRGVSAGSVPNSGKSDKQLQYEVNRYSAASANQSAKAYAAAAEAAAASDAKIAASAQATAEKAGALAEQYADRAKAARQELLSNQLAADAEATASAKAAANAQAQAAKDASDAAALAAKQKKEADKQAKLSADEAAAAIEKQAAAEQKLNRQMTDLRSSIDPAYAAQQRYNQTMQQATTLLMEGKLKQGEWIQIQKQAAAQQEINTRSMGRFNNMNIQVGYQMQDVVASYAAGINPLVILSEQAGQTASALSGMGGTAGKVAAFMAGPWGAAILGAILVIGMITDSVRKHKDATLDLSNAQSVESAKLDELITKMKEYNKQLKEANENDFEKQQDKNTQNQVLQNAKVKEYLDLQQKIKDTQSAIDDLAKNGSQDGSQGAIVGLTLLLKYYQSQIDKMKEVRDQAKLTDQQTRISNQDYQAKGAADPRTAIEQKYQALLANTNVIYNKAYQIIIDKHLPAIEQARQLANLDNITAAKKTQILKDQATALKDLKDEGKGLQDYLMPVEGKITSGFGQRETFKTNNGQMASRDHQGIDIAAPLGTAVKAAQDAVVKFAGVLNGYGKTIILDHGAGVTTRYAHLGSMNVQQGQRVSQGDQIGQVGMTGNSTGPHLHYEVRKGGKAVDPTKARFPTDALKAYTEAYKSQETQAQKTAAAEEKVVNAQMKMVESDDSKTNEQKLKELEAYADQKIAIEKRMYAKDKSSGQNDAVLAQDKAKVEAAEAEKAAIIHQYQQKVLADKISALKAEEKAQETSLSTQQSAENTAAEISKSKTDWLVENNMLSERKQLVEKGKQLDQDYQREQAHEEQLYQLKVSYLQRQMALPNQTRSQQQQLEQEITQLTQDQLSKRLTAQQKYAQDVTQINQQSATQSMKGWKTMTDTFTSSINTAFQGLWTHSTSIQQSMLNIADQLVYKVEEQAMESVSRQAMIWLGLKTKKQVMDNAELATKKVKATTETALDVGTAAKSTAVSTASTAQQTANIGVVTGAHAAGETAKTAATVAGATTGSAIRVASATSDITTEGGKAAAGAFSSTVKIPFIGPVSAPAAAALALATVLGFMSLIHAEGGQAEVPYDGQLSMLHKKEMVLPAWAASPLRASLKAGNSSALFGNAADAGTAARTSNTTNNGATFNYQPQHTNMNADMQSLLRSDGRSLRRWINNEMRNGTLNLSKGGKR